MSHGQPEFQYLEVELRDDACVARVNVPCLSEEINLEQIGHELFSLVDQRACRKLAVSLRGVQYMTSSGIGKLITLHRKMHRQNGSVIFCEIEQAVDDILRSSKLNTYFHIVPELDAALCEFSGAADRA